MHLQTFPELPADWRDETLAARWARIREIRRVVTGALERERAEGRIRASLPAWNMWTPTSAPLDRSFTSLGTGGATDSPIVIR